MDLYKYQPQEIIYLDRLDLEFIEKYHLTLPYYTVGQLIAITHQFHPTKESQQYLDRAFIKKEENDSFRHGVIDAFSEIVRAGVKKIAFSHATNSLELFNNDLYHAHACAKKYNIYYYIEENLIETCLFHNSGRYVIILYSNKQDIEDYLKLKEEIFNQKNPTLDQQIKFGKELGRLLSYSNERIEAMIQSYFA